MHLMCERWVAVREKIEAGLRSGDGGKVQYFSEWLGYLPYGLYHWVEVDGKSISERFPSDWTLSDLEHLARVGFLRETQRYRDPDDEFEFRVTYSVVKTGAFGDPYA